MKTIIIVAIIIGVIAAGTLSYFAYQLKHCESLPGWWHYPRQLTIWDCLQMYVDDTLPHYENLQKFLDTKIGSEFDLPSVKITEIKNSNEIIISGSVGNPIDDASIAIFIKNQDNELLQVAQVAPNEDGQFSYSIDANGSVWENTTNYFVEINYNDLKSVIGSDWGKRK